MNVILPPYELLRRAAAWVMDAKTELPDASVPDLVDKACLRFDLSPADSQLLANFFTKPQQGQDSQI